MFDFVVISFKNHYLAKLRNFQVTNIEGKEALGAESLQRLAIFENLLLK